MRLLDDIILFLYTKGYLSEISEKQEIKTICKYIRIYVKEDYGNDINEEDILACMLPYFENPQRITEKGKDIIKKYNLQEEFERYVADWHE